LSYISKESGSHFLLILFSLSFPISVFAGNFFALLIVIFWLLTSNIKNELKKIHRNKVITSSFLFFLAHVVGLIWTEDFEWGFHIIKKMLEFAVLLPILFSLIKANKSNIYIFCFLFSVGVMVFFSYLIWLGIIEPFKNAELGSPTPFMTRISHTPIVAFSAYIIGNTLFMELRKNKNKNKIFVFFLLFILFAFNVLITGGRSGQLAFFALLGLLFFQNFNLNFKNLIKYFITLTLVFFLSFNFLENFQKRVIETYDDFLTYEENAYTNLGMRMKLAENSLILIKENILFGVGTGDFPAEYKNVNSKNKSNLPNATNPHNMYLLVLSQLGIFGLFFFVRIFYMQLKSLHKTNSFFRNLGLGLIVFFIIINIGESYMLGHYTSFLFVFFSAFLFSNNEQQ